MATGDPTFDQIYNSYKDAMAMIVGGGGIVTTDDGLPWTTTRDTTIPLMPSGNGPWVPNVGDGQPWVHPQVGGYPHALPYQPNPVQITPLGPPLMPTLGTTTVKLEPTAAEMKELLSNYRFLIKSIRSLANAGKLNPEIALQAIDALLMALDDNYDKLDAQAK